jgi:hypothetical protein
VSVDPGKLRESRELPLSEQEQRALRLAAELQDRVRRERAVVRRLRAYLDTSVDPTES